MAYNSTTGSQMSGDIRYENDPEDTQIDFENDSITFKAGNSNNLVIAKTSITASVLLSSSMPISASSFWVDGVQVTAGGTPGGSNTQVQYNNGGDFAGSANLTFDGTTITARGATLGTSSADTVTIRAATINVPNIAAGTDNTVVVYNGSTLVTDEIDSRVWGSTLVDATGTPSANQVATWSDANTTQGSANLTFDGTTLAVAGTVSGSKGLYDLTNGTLQVGTEEVGTGGIVKISTTTDNSIPLMVKTPSHETIFAVTGSGKVAVGGVHLDAKFNVTGSDQEKLLSLKSDTKNPVFYVKGDGEMFISGNVIVRNTHPTMYFSNSAGTGLGEIGFNSSDNILVQNKTANKHIVFKTSDAGSLKEGLRIDGAVPEVVVNQSSDSLIDFRVESNSNTHMLFVDGSANKVGIDTDAPEVKLDINDSAIRIRNSSTPSSASDFGMAGEIRWDANYIYVCIATDTWKRVAISTW